MRYLRLADKLFIKGKAMNGNWIVCDEPVGLKREFALAWLIELELGDRGVNFVLRRNDGIIEPVRYLRADEFQLGIGRMVA